ncbi:Hypothetical protein SCF082_LOCUS25660 [Durusdinium trenchii]|uniref:Uncharacterized protein n=1 Tax=Durusdinium trenchii TaxID=1381693 RepID=A0ABP0M1Q0_9DINO
MGEREADGSAPEPAGTRNRSRSRGAKADVGATGAEREVLEGRKADGRAWARGDFARQRLGLAAPTPVLIPTAFVRQMISKANKVKHHSEAHSTCKGHTALMRARRRRTGQIPETSLLGLTGSLGSLRFIPVWVERSGQKSAMDRLKAGTQNGRTTNGSGKRMRTAPGSGCERLGAVHKTNRRVSMSSQALYRFADLLMAVSSIFSVPCHRQVHIFEEDTQTVAFNSGALFFNLRFFTEECHDQSWEEAVSFWTVSFAHELAHFESPVHDRQHGRAMEMSQRAILPRIPQILARPWGAAPGSAAVAYRTWKLRATDGGLI